MRPGWCDVPSMTQGETAFEEGGVPDLRWLGAGVYALLFVGILLVIGMIVLCRVMSVRSKATAFSRLRDSSDEQ